MYEIKKVSIELMILSISIECNNDIMISACSHIS